MALQVQFNNDNTRINISRFEECINYKEESIQEPIIEYLLDLDVSKIEDYTQVQNYLSQFAVRNSINSIKILKNETVLYTMERYKYINSLFVRPDSEDELLFTVHFENPTTNYD